jgi:hypothetical protein
MTRFWFTVSPISFTMYLIVLFVFFKHYSLAGFGVFIFSFFFFLLLDMFTFFIKDKKVELINKKNHKIDYILNHYVSLKSKIMEPVFKQYILAKKKIENRYNFYLICIDSFKNISWFVMPIFSTIVVSKIYVFENSSMQLWDVFFMLSLFYMMAHVTRHFGKAIRNHNDSVASLNKLNQISVLVENKEYILLGKEIKREPKPKKKKTQNDTELSELNKTKHSFRGEIPSGVDSMFDDLEIEGNLDRSNHTFETNEKNNISELDEIREMQKTLDHEENITNKNMKVRNIVIEFQDVFVSYSLLKFDKILADEDSHPFTKIIESKKLIFRRQL